MREAEQFNLIDHAYRCGPPHEAAYFRIGTKVLRVLFSECAFGHKMTRAFAHLKIMPTDAFDFTIYLWSTHSHFLLPSIDWNLICQNGYRGHFKAPIYFHYFATIHALSAIHMDKKCAHYVVKNADSLPWWVAASPFQVILNVWMRSEGFQLTHTAAVGNERAAVLLCGPGGSGKSTTTLTCLQRGMYYLGEDYCLLRSSEVFGVYQTAKWEAKTRQDHPHYEAYIENPEESKQQKALVYYQDIFPHQLLQQATISAFVTLRIGKDLKPRLEEISHEEGLQNLMTSTFFQLPLYEQESFTILKECAMSLNALQLTLSKDYHANTALIQELL